jgi:hypothetical protein
VTERRQLAPDMVGARARLHADQAARNVGEMALTGISETRQLW